MMELEWFANGLQTVRQLIVTKDAQILQTHAFSLKELDPVDQ
jgi:hypothetical protein